MDTKKILLIGGGGLALWYLLKGNSKTTTPTADNPQGLVGVNSGIPGGNGSFTTVANYAALLAAVPELGNPNHTLTADEQAQYLANYLDLRQGLATWTGGITAANVQRHWNKNGCAEKRIYLPLVPPSGAAYVAPPASSGSNWSWVGTALEVAGTVVMAVAGVGTPDLNPAEIQCLITGAAVMNDILPFYQSNNEVQVNQATNRLHSLLAEYV